MDIIYLPRIAETDHYALQNLIPLYPPYAYDKWLDRQKKEVADWEGKGAKVILVDVGVDEITDYCRRTGARHNLQVLKAVALEKGKREIH